MDIIVLLFATHYEKCKRGDFDFFMGGGAHGPDPDALTEKIGSYGSSNYLGWNNSRVDELLDLGRSTVDIEKRKEYYYEMQEILIEEMPRITYALYAWAFCYRTEYSGFFTDPTLKNYKNFDFRLVQWEGAGEEPPPETPLPIELVAGAAVAAIVVIAGAAYWLGRRSRPA